MHCFNREIMDEVYKIDSSKPSPQDPWGVNVVIGFKDIYNGYFPATFLMVVW